MLDAVIGPEFGFRYTNMPAPEGPGLTWGTDVPIGLSGAEGAWVEIAAAANITTEIYGVFLNVNGGNTTAQAQNHLLDLGIDPAGGTSYTAIISNLVCGYSASSPDGRYFYFPIRIPAGSSVAVRIQGSAAVDPVLAVAATFYGMPQRPELARAGQHSETIGTITGSNGVNFTPGVAATEGAWQSLGTTSIELWWWQIGFQINDATMNVQTIMLDLAYGDVTNKVPIIENAVVGALSTESINSALAINAYKRVPPGSEIFIRGSTTLAVADSNYNAVAVGIGG